MVACQLTDHIRYQRDLRGLYFQYKVNEFLFPAITFNIILGRDYFFYLLYIFIVDMPFIGTRMDRDTVRAKTLYIDGGFYEVGIITSSCITQCCKLVDIDT